ncbi:hypothetical protein D3C73_1270890 [compost metagenome]
MLLRYCIIAEMLTCYFIDSPAYFSKLPLNLLPLSSRKLVLNLIEGLSCKMLHYKIFRICSKVIVVIHLRNRDLACVL